MGAILKRHTLKMKNQSWRRSLNENSFRTVPGTAPDETEEKSHDEVLEASKNVDQDTKPAETQGTNDSDKTINYKTLGDASLVAEDVGSTSLKGPEEGEQTTKKWEADEHAKR